MSAGLPTFFRYNLWANLQLLIACSHLSDVQLDAISGPLGSVRATLLHLLVAEERYVGVLTGFTPTLRLDDFVSFPGFVELRRRAEQSGEELIMVAEQDELDHLLPLDDPSATVVMLQAMQSAIDHRSRIILLLRRREVPFPDLDGWAYNHAMRVRSDE